MNASLTNKFSVFWKDAVPFTVKSPFTVTVSVVASPNVTFPFAVKSANVTLLVVDKSLTETSTPLSLN
jgi:ABC-type molybdate transport system permease subunit